jgi:hypothetical protein
MHQFKTGHLNYLNKEINTASMFSYISLKRKPGFCLGAILENLNRDVSPIVKYQFQMVVTLKPTKQILFTIFSNK